VKGWITVECEKGLQDGDFMVEKRRQIVSRFVYKCLGGVVQDKVSQLPQNSADTRMRTVVTVVDAYLQCADGCKLIESNVGCGECEFL
jgi:hypothetical protein